MSRLTDTIEKATSDLGDFGVKFALVGGLAVSVRAEPRFTRDIDLAIDVASDSEAEALVHFLFRRKYQLHLEIEQKSKSRLAAVRLLAPNSDSKTPLIDLMFASSGIESETVEEAEAAKVMGNITLDVAQLEHLIAMKVLSYNSETRLQDAMDLKALLSKADSNAVGLARELINLIATRGFNRGKDLPKEFEQMVARYWVG